MEGWLKRDNGSSVEESLDTPQTQVHFDFESHKKANSLFNQFVKAFLKEVFGVSCYRPLPPVIGEGQEVDLFKLHSVVRNRGGYSKVSENGLWSSVAIECGFDLITGAALKLVYVKYLYTLDRWLLKINDKKEKNTRVKEVQICFSGHLMELESDLKVFLSGITDIVKEEKFVEFKKRSLEGGPDDKGFMKLNVNDKNVNEKQSIDKGGDDEEDPVVRKRKRESCVSMLNWLIKVAKDPCDPAIDPLPKRHKWKCYGSELEWKQVLLVREAMLLKKNVDASSQQSVLQKKQKMHPSMYEDDQCGSERLRCSRRLLTAKDSSRKTQVQHSGDSSSSGCQSDDEFFDNKSDSTADSDNFWFNCRRQKRVPIGPSLQADLPKFCGDDYEGDSKWLATKIWPLDTSEQKKSCLIERDPIGKGRQESCGCEFSGSPECVRFHIREKMMKIRLELGSAFYKWKFDNMGEIVALSWTNKDENKFRNIVESNRLSSEKYFWDELFKFFPEKGREALVSYYFNVFLLRRRIHHNRSNAGNIDSDDEESEFGPIANRFGQMAATSPGSIFCSPKKSHLNSK
ncbi:hypothetical protein CDL12_08741 [Handroanthus impetiginosus]|uniref:ARID domain-containing protein n=1 Tax=Handroanthus impetiginosus TaxID=429701 RepID=A0A2G9HM36_9LAMI|nr:hypothetical protein CDL12_08741 [Handroanthus impetiginosus]